MLCLMDNDIHPLNNWDQLVIIQDVGALRKLILFVFFCQAYEERIKAIVQVADELERENFHESDRIQQRFVQQFCLNLMLGVTS